jgi:hypothetical protein
MNRFSVFALAATMLAMSPAAHAESDPNDYTEAVAAIEQVKLVSSKASHAEVMIESTAKACPITYPAHMVQELIDGMARFGEVVNHADADKMADLYVKAINTYPTIKDKLCSVMRGSVACWQAKHPS